MRSPSDRRRRLAKSALCHKRTHAVQQKIATQSPPSAYLVLNFRDVAPPSPRGVLPNATPRRLPLRLITRNLSSGNDLRPSAAFPNYCTGFLRISFSFAV